MSTLTQMARKFGGAWEVGSLSTLSYMYILIYHAYQCSQTNRAALRNMFSGVLPLPFTSPSKPFPQYESVVTLEALERGVAGILVLFALWTCHPNKLSYCSFPYAYSLQFKKLQAVYGFGCFAFRNLEIE